MEVEKGTMIRKDGSIQEFCVWDKAAIPEERRRRRAVTCSKACAGNRRKHYLLERKQRYRKAAGLPRKGLGTVGEEKRVYGQRNHVPGASQRGQPGVCLPSAFGTAMQDRT